MTLDEVDGPFRGPCGICGGPDARHRMWDAIEGTARAESVRAAAIEYGKTPEQVRFLVREYAASRRRHRPLPGRVP
jgi:hypothetical protein